MSLTQQHLDSDNTTEKIALNLARADRLRQSILKSAFEGKLCETKLLELVDAS